MNNSSFPCKIIGLSNLQVFSVISVAWLSGALDVIFSAVKLIIGSHLEL